MKQQRKFTRILLSTGLSLTIALAGVAVLPAPSAHAATTSSQASATAQRVIDLGKKYMGTPYKFGARTGDTRYFDCSSFTQYVYKQVGINLPRTSKAQSQVGKYVKRSDLKPGDLVFFYSPIHHVGIYIGNGKVLHTYGKPGVTISDMNSGWWSSHYATARRVIN